jgi:outer membrane protein TolC
MLGLLIVLAEAAAPAPAPLNFTDALTQVTAKSLDVRRAAETQATADARKEQARYVYFPTLNAYGKLNPSGFDPGGSDQSRSAGVELGANLYRFGGDKAQANQADATARQTALSARAAVADAEAQAALALLAVVEIENEVAVEEGIQADRQNDIAMAKKLFARGVRSAQDVDKVSVDAANDAARLADARVRLAQANADLATIAGGPVGVAKDWPWLARFRNGAGAMANLNADPTQRADRQALAARVEALDAAADQARAKRLPSLDAVVDYSYQDQRGPDEVPYRGRTWSGTLTLTAPLFDRLQAVTDEEEQRHLRAAAELDVTAKDQAVLADFTAAKSSFITAVASAGGREQTLSTAKDLYQHSLKSFQAGLLGASELSLDAGRLHDAELLAVQGWNAAHTSFVKLCRSLDRRIADCVATLK